MFSLDPAKWGQCCQPPVAFPRVVLTAQASVLLCSPAGLAFLQMLSVSTLGVVRGQCAKWANHRMGAYVCRWGMWSVCGDHRPVGGPIGEASPVAHGQAFRWSLEQVVGSIYVPLVLSKCPGCCSPSLSSPPVVYHTLVFWMGHERSGSLSQCPAELGTLSAPSNALTFPHERNHRLQRSLGWAVLPRVSGDVFKVKLFSLPSSICPTLGFLKKSNKVLELPHWIPRLPSTKALLSIGDFSK